MIKINLNNVVSDLRNLADSLQMVADAFRKHDKLITEFDEQLWLICWII